MGFKMDDTGQNLSLMRLTKFLFVLLSLKLISGDIIIQDDANCGSLRYPREHRLNDRNEEIIVSHSGPFYLPGRDCVVSILGRTDYQFEITLEFMQVDGSAELDPSSGMPIKCHDYLKIYDSPRADNAKLLTPITGLCGRGSLPQTRTFTTSCPFLSLEFVTDGQHESYKGFNLKVIQYPWRNPGNLYPGAGLVAGASWSCYFNEFQPGWDYQSDTLPGTGGDTGGSIDWDKTAEGIYCYTCKTCSVDTFNPADYPQSSYGSCFRCAKIFDVSRGDAERGCYSQSEYLDLIESLQDTDLDPSGYLGCLDYTTEYNVVKKYCFCDSDHCNGGNHLLIKSSVLIASSLLGFLVLFLISSDN